MKNNQKVRIREIFQSCQTWPATSGQILLRTAFSQLYPRVSTPRVRYIRACVYFCLLSIRCFNVVQPETRFHFQSVNQIAKKGPKFQNFTNLKKKKILSFFLLYTSREVYSLWGRVEKMLFRPISEKQNSLSFNNGCYMPPW
jgi:hypothetical protein